MAGRPKGSKNKATILRENAEAQAKIRRMMAEDDGPAYFVCACCGKRFMHQKDNFPLRRVSCGEGTTITSRYVRAAWISWLTIIPRRLAMRMRP